ncbi:MAG: hypothetical protein ACW97Z_17750 [Candidatus Hodarchaeales archaeon]
MTLIWLAFQVYRLMGDYQCGSIGEFLTGSCSEMSGMLSAIAFYLYAIPVGLLLILGFSLFWRNRED